MTIHSEVAVTGMTGFTEREIETGTEKEIETEIVIEIATETVTEIVTETETGEETTGTRIEVKI
jgi:hypothetical protein